MSLRVNEHCILEDLPLDAIYLASEELEDFRIRKQFKHGSYFYAEIERLIARVEEIAKDFIGIHKEIIMLEKEDEENGPSARECENGR